jgi:hypothetical protein
MFSLSPDQTSCIYDPISYCNTLHPYQQNDHGYVCANCNDDQCYQYIAKNCEEDGYILNGWQNECRPCATEFGNGTLTCNNFGAVTKTNNSYFTSIQVNEMVYNTHANLCNESIANCEECPSADQCVRCEKDYTLNENGTFCKGIDITKDPFVCNARFPYPFDDHGTYCAQCTDKECIQYENTTCEFGYVFNGWNMSCVPCKEAFGLGTMSCSNGGALQCFFNYVLTDVNTTVNITNTDETVNITNKVCSPCSEVLNHCQQCSSSDRCLQCMDGYLLDEFGQCMTSSEECTKKFPYAFDDHGWYCNQCSDLMCTEYVPALCNETGEIYVGSKQKCVPCTEEFGAGTISCSNWGANQCREGSYQETKKVNDTISNVYCTNCNATIPNCSLCTDGERCQQCEADFILTDGRCLQS